MIRSIRRAPGLFAIAVTLISLGVAMTTLIYTLADAVLLRRLPVKDPQNLVEPFRIYGTSIPSPYLEAGFVREIAAESATLFDVFGQSAVLALMDIGGNPQRVERQYVTDNFFSVLGVKAVMGRTIDPGEWHVAVISHDFWEQKLGRDPAVIGKTVRIDGRAFQIVGVTPETFNGTSFDYGADVRIPQRTMCEFSVNPKCSLDNQASELIGRLRPGVSLAQAQEELDARWHRYEDHAADRQPDPTAYRQFAASAHLQIQSIERGVSTLRTQFQAPLIVLISGTGLLMMMVCANVGGLLLARAAGLEKETAVRFAIGATRWRIVRQWASESLALAAVGGSAGLLLAFAGIPLLKFWIPPVRGVSVDLALQTPSLHLHPNLRIALVCLGVCTLTAILSAVAPAWSASRGDLQLALKTAMSDRRHRRFQTVLCTIQVAFGTILLISTALTIRTLANLHAANPGFDRDHVVAFSVDPMLGHLTSEQTWSMQNRVREGVREMPGVQSASLAGMSVMQGYGHAMGVVFPGQRLSTPLNTSANEATPRYFATMGIRLIAGRDFAETDLAMERKPKPAIVNEAFVRRFLPDQNPLGKVFDTAREYKTAGFEIVGVVSDVKYRYMREVPPPIFYISRFGPKEFPNAFVLNVRTQGDPEGIIQPVRKLLQSITPDLPITHVATLAQEIDRSLWQERLTASLASVFSLFAILLSTIGLYGLLAYYVSRRRREIGLRMALGAERLDIASLIARRLIPALGAGLVLGGVLAFLVARSMRTLLYGVEPFDLKATATTIALLGIIGITAATLPMLRAIRLDPAISLREE